MLSAAIWRYEHCWLPLLQRTASSRFGDVRKLAAPLDVAWVWLVHLLHPLDYAKVRDDPCCTPALPTLQVAWHLRVATVSACLLPAPTLCPWS